MAKPKLNIAGTGLIYRNDKPHVSSIHAYFPWVACLPGGDLLASFVIGEAFESVNADTYFTRSHDMGRSWTSPRPVLSPAYKQLRSNCGRITALGNGSMAMMMVRSNREMHPGEGLANPDNMGFVPTDLLLARSPDGSTWEDPQHVDPPLTGPSFEACSPIVVLRDGRWLWSTSTWRGWDGFAPNGMKMVALVSNDEGKTWLQHLDVMDGRDHGIIYWEGKILELQDGRLLAVSWAFDETRGMDLPNHFSVSRDGGNSWLPPASTTIQGQTMAAAELEDGKLIVVYRRMDKPGLWLTLARLHGDEWINEQDFPLWGVMQDDGAGKKPQNMVHEFNELKFGAPCVIALPDHSLYIAFWCYEKMVSNIRWLRVTLT